MVITLRYENQSAYIDRSIRGIETVLADSRVMPTLADLVEVAGTLRAVVLRAAWHAVECNNITLMAPLDIWCSLTPD